MRSSRAGPIICLLLIGLVRFDANAQITSDLATDPAKATIVYDDVRNLAHALDLLKGGGDTVATLQAEYFARATPGLRELIKDYDLTAESLTQAIQQRPREFGSLVDVPEWLAAQESTFRNAFAQLQQLIPNAVFPPTYFVVGAWVGASEATEQGQVISVERHGQMISAGRPDAADHLAHTIVHELVHVQQALTQGLETYQSLYGDGPNRSLLALAIREGSADFLADLASGGHTHERAQAYCVQHEPELWERFRAEMAQREPGSWMWAEPRYPEEPRDLGYAMGFRIVKAYYEQAPDKKGAVRDILSVTDYPVFLELSGYAKRFAER
ncbi:MAG: hypothetical protein GTN78_05445 [Gemmatimonadales bacterium]|nr:hypothetical protein [Gemmatimonadales bacterium]NIN13479.1 hypothetical protein [Gemmatimonadales bacterium]NIQ99631.1 hypothetical protein [Gemmatimonadales bacterium]NIS64188.1 hypothetical protein [Gemmatimonadales bacterium]